MCVWVGSVSSDRDFAFVPLVVFSQVCARIVIHRIIVHCFARLDLVLLLQV